MACNKRGILKSLIIDGEGYTPQDEWTVTAGGINREMMRHLNGAISTKEIPEIDVASGGIIFDTEAKLNELIGKCGIVVTLNYSNGSVVQLTNAAVTGHTTIETDGFVSLEISGIQE